MKNFYSCLDYSCVDLVTQPLQHVCNGDMAKQNGGSISFYTIEGPDTLAGQDVIRAKIEEKPTVDGIVFFRLMQFLQGEKFDFDLLKKIIDLGYEVHFTREKLSIVDEHELNEQFETLYCYELLLNKGVLT